MTLRSIAFVCIAAFGLSLPAFADEVRVATDPEKMQVTDALTKDGYHMVDQIRVDNDKFRAYAKTKDGQDVEVTLDLATLKVLKVDKKK